GSYLLNGVSINTAGTLSNIAYLTNTSQAFTGINTFSRNGSGSSDASLVVNGTPVNNATSSLIRIGNSIAGGNASANGGTYLGLNAPNTGAGSAADFVNFQKNGSSKFSITNAGITTSATSLLTPLLDTASAGTLSLGTTTATGINLNQSTTVATGKNLIIGTAALATNATTGFLYLDTSAGAPTGTPLANTGTVATEYDTTNNKLCVFNSAWKCTAALADYAEWMPAAGATAGDVVSITEQKNPVADPTAPFMLGRSTGPYEHAIAGVVSHYAEEANMANGYKQSADYHAIALAGRVPVKVTASNGPIAVGDYLTSSSLPGVAMKATQAGTIIGKALESYSSSDPQTVGEILVLVNVSYTNPDTQTGNRLQPAPAPFDTATASVLHVGRTNATSIALDQATIVHDAADSATAFQVQKADGMPLLTVDATHMKVVVTNLEVTGTLTVRGHFLAGGAVPIVAPGAAACQQPTVTITGNDILGRVTITTGQGCTISGALASVTFQTAYGAAPIVMLTPEGQSSAALLGYATTAPQQFTINTSIPPRERTTYTFTYLVGQAISP
ncbi:MAG TPA: hypothetical protein VFV38_20410, partial [Ktedonobacteraceae bacterium]|nr:hypothetical protein [Ktedonobacteraceae bacterium]